MMDRDFALSSRDIRLTFSALVVSGIVGLLLFGGVLPGLRPDFTPPATVTVDGQSYYWTAFTVPLPLPFSEVSGHVSVAFHNVTFWAWITNWSIVGGEYLHGNASEPNGSVYPFVMGGFPAQTNWTDQYVTPGALIVIQWTGGLVAYFLVLT
ncbi:MAG: hypothetical protein WBG19_03570 [Thermoplasmata archaeon]